MYKNFFDDVTNQQLISSWNKINWSKKAAFITKVQNKIYKSALRGKKQQVKHWQKILLGSLSAKLFAVRSVTIERNNSLSSIVKVKIALTLQFNLNGQNYSNDDEANLNILYDKDQLNSTYNSALKFIINLALEPEWEAYFEPDTFGFRPYFFAKDAIITLCKKMQKNTFKYIVLSKAEPIFLSKTKNIYLIKKLATSKIIAKHIKAWLDCKILNEANIKWTEDNLLLEVPIYLRLDYLILNILFYSIRYKIISNAAMAKADNPNLSTAFSQTQVWKDSIYYLSYGNHFCILCNTAIVAKWLNEAIQKKLFYMKYKVSHNYISIRRDKTINFNFLGFTIALQGDKLHILPSFNSKKQLIYAIRQQLYKKDLLGRRRALTHLSLEKAIKQVNPIISFWASYYEVCTSLNTLQGIDKIINNTFYRWQIKKYKRNVSNNWKQQCIRYIKSQRRIAQGKQVLSLFSEYYLKRHIYKELTYCRSKYDQDLEYWQLREK